MQALVEWARTGKQSIHNQEDGSEFQRRGKEVHALKKLPIAGPEALLFGLSHVG